MKTQIIQLEAHDDLISARDKVGASRARRVLLVWPRQVRLLNRRLDLALLQRYSNTLGVQMGFVTQDEEILFYAAQLGIPTFKTSRQAQTDRWRTTRRPRKQSIPPGERPFLADLYLAARSPYPSWLEHISVRLLAFIVSLVAVLTLATFILPSAVIILTPSMRTQNVTIPVRTNSKLSQPVLAGEVPVTWTTIVVEGRDTISASGTALAPERAATGSVVFSNLTEQAIDIPAGAVVTTLDAPLVRFVTTSAGRVASGIGKAATITVRAVVPGSSGNLPANQIQAIEGNLGLSLTVNNPNPTSQGKDQPVASPTTADRNALLQSLQADLQNTARREIEMLYAGNATRSGQADLSDLPLLPTLRLKRTLEESFLPEPGQPADELTLILRLEFEYQVVSAAHLQALADSILSAAAAPGYQPLPETLQIDHHSPFSLSSEGSVAWKMTIQQKMESEIVPEKASQIVRGKHVEQALALLQDNLDLAMAPSIQIVPGWWPYLPYLPFRIKVSVQSEHDQQGVWMMRVLAVDPGEKRLGIAISDPTGTIANPLTVLKHSSRPIDAAEIVALAEEHGAGLIVVGQQLDSENHPTPQGRRAARLAEAIKVQTNLPVALWDESGSTKAARSAHVALGGSKRQRERNRHLDDLAATYILQTYLDENRVD
jgi:putative holliday junction resolvase